MVSIIGEFQRGRRLYDRGDNAYDLMLANEKAYQLMDVRSRKNAGAFMDKISGTNVDNMFTPNHGQGNVFVTNQDSDGIYAWQKFGPRDKNLVGELFKHSFVGDKLGRHYLSKEDQERYNQKFGKNSNISYEVMPGKEGQEDQVTVSFESTDPSGRKWYAPMTWGRGSEPDEMVFSMPVSEFNQALEKGFSGAFAKGLPYAELTQLQTFNRLTSSMFGNPAAFEQFASRLASDVAAQQGEANRDRDDISIESIAKVLATSGDELSGADVKTAEAYQEEFMQALRPDGSIDQTKISDATKEQAAGIMYDDSVLQDPSFDKEMKLGDGSTITEREFIKNNPYFQENMGDPDTPFYTRDEFKAKRLDEKYQKIAASKLKPMTREEYRATAAALNIPPDAKDGEVIGRNEQGEDITMYSFDRSFFKNLSEEDILTLGEMGVIIGQTVLISGVAALGTAALGLIPGGQAAVPVAIAGTAAQIGTKLKRLDNLANRLPKYKELKAKVLQQLKKRKDKKQDETTKKQDEDTARSNEEARPGDQLEMPFGGQQPGPARLGGGRTQTSDRTPERIPDRRQRELDLEGGGASVGGRSPRDFDRARAGARREMEEVESNLQAQQAAREAGEFPKGELPTVNFNVGARTFNRGAAIALNPERDPFTQVFPYEVKDTQGVSEAVTQVLRNDLTSAQTDAISSNPRIVAEQLAKHITTGAPLSAPLQRAVSAELQRMGVRDIRDIANMRDTPKALFYSAAIAMAQREPEQREKVYRDMMGFVLTGGLPASSRKTVDPTKGIKLNVEAVEKIAGLEKEINNALFDTKGNPLAEPDYNTIFNNLNLMTSYIEGSDPSNPYFLRAADRLVPSMHNYLFGLFKEEGGGGTGWVDKFLDSIPGILGGRKTWNDRRGYNFLDQQMRIEYDEKTLAPKTIYLESKDRRTTTDSLPFSVLTETFSDDQMLAYQISMANRELKRASRIKKPEVREREIRKFQTILRQLKNPQQ